MSYLHAKEIVHKDLTTKNIFLENHNHKVVITDFGLFSVRKLRYNNGLHIPNNWLCHLAPELIRSLKQTKRVHDELQFTKTTDVYAFGTVWYVIIICIILSNHFLFNFPLILYDSLLGTKYYRENIHLNHNHHIQSFFKLALA